MHIHKLAALYIRIQIFNYFTAVELLPLLKTCHLAQRKGMGSQKEQDLCTFLDRHDLDEYHLLIFLYWKQVSQIRISCVCKSRADINVC